MPDVNLLDGNARLRHAILALSALALTGCTVVDCYRSGHRPDRLSREEAIEAIGPLLGRTTVPLVEGFRVEPDHYFYRSPHVSTGGRAVPFQFAASVDAYSNNCVLVRDYFGRELDKFCFPTIDDACEFVGLMRSIVRAGVAPEPAD